MAEGGDGGGFDPCECVFSQEAGMRQLLSLVNKAERRFDCVGSHIFFLAEKLPELLYRHGMYSR